MAYADMDFEKELWNAANELRGAVPENYFKNYIFLPLTFVKHPSKSSEVGRDEFKELKDPNSNFYTTDTEEINYRFQY